MANSQYITIAADWHPTLMYVRPELYKIIIRYGMCPQMLYTLRRVELDQQVSDEKLL